jgi:hypothetical protein
MTEQLVTANAEDVPHASAANMTLIARSRDELQAEQRRLISWCDAKLVEINAEREEFEGMIALHKLRKWKTSTLQGALNKARQRVTFYEKVKAALDAGFYIVPNFPGDVFAIRTNREPLGVGTSSYSGRDALARMPQQAAAALPIGAGEYQSPRPMGYVEEHPSADGKRTDYTAVVSDFATIKFPFAFAKAEILTATQEAMSLRLFDELAALPSRARKADPMIVGRIVRPGVPRWSRDRSGYLSLLVIWWLDTSTI